MASCQQNMPPLLRYIVIAIFLVISKAYDVILALFLINMRTYDVILALFLINMRTYDVILASDIPGY